MSEKFYQDIAKIAEAIADIHRRAVIAYTPLVEEYVVAKLQMTR